MKICTICLKVADERKIFRCCGKDLVDIVRSFTGSIFIGNDEPDWQYVKYYYIDKDIPHSNPKKR